MIKNYNGETKTHFKSYKAGKRWVFAGITVLAVSLGLAGVDVTANAATTDGSVDASSELVNKDVSGNDTNKNNVVNGDSNSNGDVNGSNDGVVNDGGVSDGSKSGDAGAKVVNNDSVDTSNTDKENVDKNTNVNKVTNTDGNVNTDTTKSSLRGALRDAAPAKTYTADEIAWKNADEWMPDASLRQAVEASFLRVYPNYQVDDTTIWNWTKVPLNLYDDMTTTPIKSLEGLQYFTNITGVSLQQSSITPDGMISFANSPQLGSFFLDDINQAGLLSDWGMTADEFVQQYLSGNKALQTIEVNDIHLTGTLPNLEGFDKLQYANFAENDLTGGIPDYSYLPVLWNLSAWTNQLSGSIPDTHSWKNFTTLRVGGNNFSGDLPDVSNLDSLQYNNNKITSGVVPAGNGIDFDGKGQSLTGDDIVLTNGHNSFNPVTGVVHGLKDVATNTPDNSVAYTLGNLTGNMTVAYSADKPGDDIAAHATWAAAHTDASNLFTVSKDADGVLGFKLTASKDTPNGYYLIKLVSPDSAYSAWVTFQVDNKMTTDPVNPVNPVDPTPGVTTGTVTVVSVDHDGNVIGKKVMTGALGDTFTAKADPIDGYKVDGNGSVTGTYSNDGQTITFTYSKLENAGDGATIDTGSNQGGAADKGVNVKAANHGGKAINLSNGAAAAKVSVKNDTKNNATVDLKSAAAKKATLPQTNDKQSMGLIALGLSMLLATLGLVGGTSKRHN
ncbi:MucBP domain-containing protein [Levilactobacillus tangyuanensis]|uniref:MucBP domain-containing protein n=1 Tax=Levilactobacillus tangyuanensis TaxID=2486021 RepID=A0ABW1TL26_9LACO|nr:MucBP domain-containing protein [Levilactobacillus tangyuanensis]